jgi:hypothetical protein
LIDAKVNNKKQAVKLYKLLSIVTGLSTNICAKMIKSADEDGAAEVVTARTAYKVSLFLYFFGYSTQERNSFSEKEREVADICVLCFKENSEPFKEYGVSYSAYRRFLAGKTKLTKLDLGLFAGTYRQQLRAKQEKIVSLIQDSSFAPMLKAVNNPPSDTSSVVVAHAGKKEESLAEAAAQAVEILSPLVDRLIAGSAQERKDFRNRVGSSELLTLKNNLAACCSEGAFKQIQQERNGQ